jgi:plastocyanin
MDSKGFAFMRLFSRISVVTGLIAGLLAMTAATAGAQTPVPTSAATGPVIQAGAGEPGYAVNLFGPNAVTIPVGGTVTFKSGWLEPHTVTFLGGAATPAPSDPKAPVPTNPGQVVAYDGTTFLNSGFITSRDAAFQVSFPKAGTYPFICIIHPGMAGTVTVGSGTPSVQADLDAAAKKVFADATVALKAEAAKLAANSVTQTKNADGTTTFKVTTVGGYVAPSDVQQFFPANMNVKIGDTVVFESKVPTPHTVTFLGGTPAPFPPSLEDPKIFGPTPAPATGYTGTGFVNSGVMGIPFPVKSFSVTFSKAGTFPYICLLHVDQGMGGTITVAALTPPATGSAGLLGGTTSTVAAVLLSIVALGLLGGARVLTGRTR